MNRITFSDRNGVFGIDGVDLADSNEIIYCSILKLSRYEDTGCEPEDIEDLKNNFLEAEGKSNG